MVIIKKKIDSTVRPYLKLKRNVSYFYNCVLIYVECSGGFRGETKGKFIKHYKNFNKNHTMKIICIGYCITDKRNRSIKIIQMWLLHIYIPNRFLIRLFRSPF